MLVNSNKNAYIYQPVKTAKWFNSPSSPRTPFLYSCHHFNHPDVTLSKVGLKAVQWAECIALDQCNTRHFQDNIQGAVQWAECNTRQSSAAQWQPVKSNPAQFKSVQQHCHVLHCCAKVLRRRDSLSNAKRRHTLKSLLDLLEGCVFPIEPAEKGWRLVFVHPAPRTQDSSWYSYSCQGAQARRRLVAK